MLVNEWVETVWKVLQVRPRTLHDYKRLYKRHLEPVIGNLKIDEVDPRIIQTKLLTLPADLSAYADACQNDLA